MRIGLVGYGTGAGNSTRRSSRPRRAWTSRGSWRAPATVAAVQGDFAGVPCHDSLAAMIRAGGIDAVTITKPPQTQRALVLEAIAAGLPAIADKPFAPDTEGAWELGRAAREKGVILGAY